MNTRKIKNISAVKAPARLPKYGTVGYGKEIEVDEAIAISLCRHSPKAWKPVGGWKVPEERMLKMKNASGRDLRVGRAYVCQDQEHTFERDVALDLITKNPDDWKPVGWTVKKEIEAGENPSPDAAPSAAEQEA